MSALCPRDHSLVGCNLVQETNAPLKKTPGPSLATLERMTDNRLSLPFAFMIRDFITSAGEHTTGRQRGCQVIQFMAAAMTVSTHK